MIARRMILAAPAAACSLAVLALLGTGAAAAEESCPNAISRQGPSVTLPDCRAYEQVTPVNKGDAEDIFPSLPPEGLSPSSTGYLSEDGNSFLLQTPAILGTGGQAFTSAYVFSRGADGWNTTAIAPGSGTNVLEPKVFSPDLSQIAFQDTQLSHEQGKPEEEVTTDLVGQPDGPYKALATAPFSEVGEGLTHKTGIVGGSANLKVVVLEGTDHEYAPAAKELDESASAIYEDRGNGLQLVDVNTDGSLVSKCGAVLGVGSLINEVAPPGGAHNAVSADGSKIVFTAPDPTSTATGSGCWKPRANSEEKPPLKEVNPPQLYMRLNGASTIHISAPEAGVVDPTLHSTIYVGASADDSKVFFLTETEVTKDDKGHALELYEYDVNAPEGDRVVRVSSGESGTVEGRVDFVPAVSADGSTVYFAAFGKLTAGVPALGSEEAYLYRYDTVSRVTTYITKVNSWAYPLIPYESARWFGRGESLPDTALYRATELGLDSRANWYTTTDGRYLVFGDVESLTGYDNKEAEGGRCPYLDAQPHPATEGDCEEIYRYSASDNSIVCVSCGAPGTRPLGVAEFARSAFQGPANLPPRPVSDDGSYVFFETTNALVPNTPSGTLHVYEWHNGVISLISSAQDPASAYFLGSSTDGQNVFFGTHAQLVPQDTDFLSDLYDARIDGGFVPVTPSLCTGTGCQGVAAAPPVFATPSSVTFEGVGNFPPSSGTPTKSTVKGLTRAQKLTRALKVCRRNRNKAKRKRCEAKADKQFAARKASRNRRGK